ncbi:PAS domain-containing sensor histidine kinase [Holophaga foetida]|uniref:PAS domain-containing sensor histidine kinase n=1 Tax=Holophaga foetida TaxID=35839 RepID=UPI0002474D73|nr:PAS domain-containing protein [Holophaga foetida]
MPFDPHIPPAPPPDQLARKRAKLQRMEAAEQNLQVLQQLIQESEARFDNLYMSLPLAYDSLDVEGRIITVNQAWLDLLGYEREEVIGRWLGDFFSPYFREDFRRHWPEVLDSGLVDGVALEYVRKDGTVLEVIVHGRTTPSQDGTWMRIHTLTQNLTERKRADEALRRSEREKALILDIMSDWVVYHDTRMEVIWANKDQVLPYADQADPITGKRCHQALYGRETPCEACPVARALETGQPETAERHHGGRSFVLRGFPVRDASGSLVGVVQVTMDITERRQLERDLLETSALERARVGRELHDGLGQLLTGMNFLASALRHRLDASGSPEADSAAQVAALATEALSQTRLLAKGLVLAHLEGKDLLEVLTDLAASLETLFRIECRVECPSGIRENQPGIFHHLHSMVREAASNAVRHGQATHLRLTARLTLGRLLLFIENDGSPLPPEAGQGPGLGLRTMKYRASALGGTLSIFNQDRGGVLVSCSLPWSP